MLYTPLPGIFLLRSLDGSSRRLFGYPRQLYVLIVDDQCAILVPIILELAQDLFIRPLVDRPHRSIVLVDDRGHRAFACPLNNDPGSRSLALAIDQIGLKGRFLLRPDETNTSIFPPLDLTLTT